MRVGIIGGTGQMGKLFSRFFSHAGYEVKVSGRQTEITNKYLAENSDIVIISVPIHATVPVIKEIIPLMRPSQILCDLTSLKSDPVQAMLCGPAEVIGLHPMFGPTAKSLMRQTIIATPARCTDSNLKMLELVFTRQGARFTITTPEHHDRMMAIIQGLTHFKALVMADTMRRMGISPADTEPFMSPVYRIETSVAGRILAQDSQLYADILISNSEIPNVLTTCCMAAEYLSGIIREGDTEKFSEFFSKNREWFGDYCQQSLEETDRLIANMVKT